LYAARITAGGGEQGMTPDLEDNLTDAALIAAFESAALPAARFTHATHVRVAWYYLRSTSLLEAIAKFSTGLRSFVASKGATSKYHETITIAYLLIISERLTGARQLSWSEFAGRNPDLFERAPSVLSRYDSEAVLMSERAREWFVLPDR
jgi:hypothetical protein